jgi:sterol 14-demethylase
MTAQQTSTSKEPAKMPGALPLIGNMLKFGKNPYEYMSLLRSKLGEIGEFRLFHQQMILLTGPEGNEAFFRAPDDQLDQNEAYKVMTPIFGKGVVFDAPPHIKDQQLKMLMPVLRDKPMRTYSKIIVEEVEEAVKDWGESGEVDLLDFMKQLTIYTSSHCLLGNEFRYELNEEFSHLYHDLEKGMHPIAFIFPYLPIPILRRRDKARVRLQKLVTEIIEKRARKTEKSDDAFQMLIDTRYDDGTPLSPHEITGLLIGTLFAGHHTTAGTAIWIALELARNPKEMDRVLEEFDTFYGHEGEVTFQSLREIPIFERVIKEVLRLHPPLIMLIRKVAKDLHFKDYVIKAGKYVCVSPRVSHRIAEIFPDPEKFDPDRFTKERQEDAQPFSWVAFGGGRHKCSGNAFAMLQLKAIYAILLRRYKFELVGSPESYQDDYTEMVVQPGSPCMVRYTKRSNIQQEQATAERKTQTTKSVSKQNCFKVDVDYDLCQGHANCMAEAPEVFQVDDKGILMVVDETPDNSLLKKAQAAAKYCPTSAIKIKQD